MIARRSVLGASPAIAMAAAFGAPATASAPTKGGDFERRRDLVISFYEFHNAGDWAKFADLFSTNIRFRSNSPYWVPDAAQSVGDVDVLTGSDKGAGNFFSIPELIKFMRDRKAATNDILAIDYDDIQQTPKPNYLMAWSNVMGRRAFGAPFDLIHLFWFESDSEGANERIGEVFEIELVNVGNLL